MTRRERALAPLAAAALVLGAPHAAALPAALDAAASQPRAARHVTVSDAVARLLAADSPRRAALDLQRTRLERVARDPDVLWAEDLARLLDRDRQDDGGRLHIVSAHGVADFDGDGGEDFLKATYDLVRGDFLFDGSLALEGIRGRDGRSLWKTDLVVEESLPLVRSARVGRRGAEGLLVENFGVVVGGGGATITPRLGLVAIAGDGEVAWEKRFDPTVAVPGARAEGIPLFARFGDFAPGAATDALFGLVTLTGPSAGFIHAMVAETSAVIVDGTGGDVFVDGTPETNWSTSPRPGALEYQGEWIPAPLPASDVDDDGVDDYAYVMAQPRHGGLVSARSSADGSELWRADGVPIGVFTESNPGADLDADGTRDLLVSTFLHPPGQDAALPHGDLLHALSGSDGRVLWEGTGKYPVLAGRIDGDAVSDVVTTSTFLAADERQAGIRYEGFSGSSGKPLYSKAHVLRYEGAGASLFTVYGRAGDLDADRVEDFFYDQSLTQKDVEPQHASKMIAGRDGTRITDGSPWVPLHESLDGAGDDIVRAVGDAERGRLEIVAANGKGDRRIWTVRFATAEAVAGTDIGPFAALSVSAGRFSGDRCPDVALDLFTESGSFLVVLDGRDGSVEWVLRLDGKGRPPFRQVAPAAQRSGC